MYGFWAAMGTAIVLYAIDLFEPVSGHQAVHIIMTIGNRRCLVQLRLPGATRASEWLNGSPTDLKERRTELGLTQAELAERVGVTRKTINTVENGVFTPSALLAIKLGQALSVPVESCSGSIDDCLRRGG